MSNLSSGASKPALDLWRDERTPTWLVLLPLLIVVVSLIALVVVPYLITERNRTLRRELTEVLAPLSSLQKELERSIATEAAAVHGYAITGEPFFADRFLSVNEYAEGVAATVDSMAAALGGEVGEAAEIFRQERAAWQDANFGLTPTELRASMPEHQERYEATTLAAQRFSDVLDREISELRQRIEEANELRFLVTLALALGALLAGAAALWLALRLRRNSKALLRRARDEAALRRIAQSMAEAEDLPGALRLIIEAVAETAQADVALMEGIDHDDIEVIAATGEGAPSVGSRAPYTGSMAEVAIERGEEVRTDAEAAMEGETRLMQRFAVDEGGHLLVVPLLSEGETVGAIALLRKRPKLPFDEGEARRARLLAGMAALILQRLSDFEEVRQKEQALQETAAELRALTETLEERVLDRTRRVQELARALTLTEQRERREVAQVLHDDLQQVLYGLQLHLLLMDTKGSDTKGSDANGGGGGLQRAQELVAEALHATRQLTVDLSPPILAGEGLVEALRWLAEHMRERFGLVVDVKACGLATVPTDDMRTLLFQTARELLFNVVKHAGTDRAVVTLSEDETLFEIEVADEGVGFDVAAAPNGSGPTLGGFGLARARERLHLFGGAIEVASESGGGTRAKVLLPSERLRSDGEA